MKFELQLRGVESLVIPNGIPERLLGGAPKKLVAMCRGALRAAAAAIRESCAL